MESWSYFPDGKGVFFGNDTDLPTDSFAKSRKFMAGWNQKPSDDMENDGLMLDFADKGIFYMSRKPLDSKSYEFCADSTGKLASPCLIKSNLSSEQKDYSSKFSSLPHQESTRMDLKLRKPLDYRNSQNNESGGGKPVIASALPAKKSRTISSCSQKPLCQVYGCNMDLSSSKDYHKRHRVCEAHSKKAKVIVNGIEQRFCQQCSRFHLLAEFDDGKRSCRRRLAGHNERRRKPSFHFLAGRQHKLLHSSHGDRFLEASFAKDFSFGLPEWYPGNLLFNGMNEQDDRESRFVKFEDESTCCSQTAIFPFHANVGNGPTISSKASFVSSIQELYGVSRSNRALSLLSSQSRQVSEAPYANFSITQANENAGQRKDLPEGVHPSRVTPMQEDQIESLLMDLGKTRAFFHESGFLNPRSSSSSSQEIGPSTVDLFQLSSHLQRVEQQRNSIQVKQEGSERSCFLGN